MSRDASRTVHAQQAMELTDLFSYKFGGLRFGQATPRKLKLQEPDGPSTAGGALARQPIVLATDEQRPETIALGWIDTAQRRAEVKTLGALTQAYRQRHQAAFDLEPGEHERMVQELRGFLKIQKIELAEVEAPPKPAKPASRVPETQIPAPSPNRGLPVGAFAAGLALGFLLGWLVFAS